MCRWYVQALPAQPEMLRACSISVTVAACAGGAVPEQEGAQQVCGAQGGVPAEPAGRGRPRPPGHHEAVRFSRSGLLQMRAAVLQGCALLLSGQHRPSSQHTAACRAPWDVTCGPLGSSGAWDAYVACLHSSAPIWRHRDWALSHFVGFERLRLRVQGGKTADDAGPPRHCGLL